MIAWVTKYHRAVAIGLAISALFWLVRYIHDGGRKEESAIWEANTAKAEAEELKKTSVNQRKSHEVRSDISARPDGDAFRLLTTDWSR